MKMMIGISTEQNTVNLIPAIQLKIDKFLIIETSLAKKKNWSQGLIEVLENRNIKFELIELNKEEDSRIDYISKTLYEKFLNSNDEIIWNLGGGQKTQQIAIWQTFTKLNREKDSVCYSNPANKKIEKWSLKDSELIYTDENMYVNISAEEIFKVYGQKVKNIGDKFYEKNQRLNLNHKVNDLFKYQEFREYFFSMTGVKQEEKKSHLYTVEELKDILYKLKKDISLKEKLKEISSKNTNNNVEQYTLSIKNHILDFISEIFDLEIQNKKNKEIVIKNPDFLKLLKDFKYYNNNLVLNYDLINLITLKKPQTPANYFEEILVKRTKKILESYDEKSFVFQAYANFESTSGEYDILLVTHWGTLIALDAKTFDVDKKDSDARLYNLILSGGKYVNWIPVIPYDVKSIKYMSNKLKSLPKTLKDIKRDFFVISDNEIDNYTTTIDTNSIEMKLFSKFISHLNLEKND